MPVSSDTGPTFLSADAPAAVEDIIEAATTLGGK
jgi:hypothetical protein